MDENKKTKDCCSEKDSVLDASMRKIYTSMKKRLNKFFNKLADLTK